MFEKRKNNILNIPKSTLNCNCNNLINDDQLSIANPIWYHDASCLSKPFKLQFFFRYDKSIQMFDFSGFTCSAWSDSWFTSASRRPFCLSNIHGQLVAVRVKYLTWKPFWPIVKVWIGIRHASKNLPNYVLFDMLWYQRAGTPLSFSKRYKLDFGATKTIEIL